MKPIYISEENMMEIEEAIDRFEAETNAPYGHMTFDSLVHLVALVEQENVMRILCLRGENRDGSTAVVQKGFPSRTKPNRYEYYSQRSATRAYLRYEQNGWMLVDLDRSDNIHVDWTTVSVPEGKEYIYIEAVCNRREYGL